MDISYKQLRESFGSAAMAYALVGQYFYEWARVENRVNRCLRTALQLNTLQSEIVAANMYIHSKLYILKTSIDLYLSDRDRNNSLRIVNRVSARTDDRNMMAHHQFFPSEDGNGVVFFTVKAKGELDFKQITWPISKFTNEFRTLDRLVRLLKIVNDRISESHGSLAALAGALADAPPAPTGMFAGLGLANPLLSPPPGRNLLGLSTSREDRETPPETEGEA